MRLLGGIGNANDDRRACCAVYIGSYAPQCYGVSAKTVPQPAPSAQIDGDLPPPYVVP
jgi:hypothetical protein